MKCSEIALKVLAAKESGLIKTNAQFWKNYSKREIFDSEIDTHQKVRTTVEELALQIEMTDSEHGIICAFDDEFPLINPMVKNNSEKPFLLFYRGDLTLLKDLNRNVAVIGVITPDEDITRREIEIVRSLVKKDLVIVSGLAMGCDTIAHKTCLEYDGKTIAIVPSQLSKIYPAENKEFAEEIVNKGGLLISEYYKDAGSKYEAINRFIERDRLQAMFSKAVVLIASYRKDEGDSGSRHAVEAARKYGIERYAMYNKKTDENNNIFGLNKDLVNSEVENQVMVLTPGSIEHINNSVNQNLITDEKTVQNEQLVLF